MEWVWNFPRDQKVLLTRLFLFHIWQVVKQGYILVSKTHMCPIYFFVLIYCYISFMHESNLSNFFEMVQLEIETMKFLDMTIKDLGLTIKTTLPYKFS
jgi:hypothetical protein